MREIGRGQPLIVLHGGPDFDTGYLLPELDQWADAFRLDLLRPARARKKRGSGASRGRHAEIRPRRSHAVRQHFRLESPALVGHSGASVCARVRASKSESRLEVGAHEPGAGVRERPGRIPEGVLATTRRRHGPATSDRGERRLPKSRSRRLSPRDIASTSSMRWRERATTKR